MRALIAVWLLLVASLVGAASDIGGNPFGGHANGATFLPVGEAYQLDLEIEENQSLRLHWQIAGGYYLYRHRFTFSLEDAAGPVNLDFDLPAGLQQTDEYFGAVEVYYRELEVRLQPLRPAGDALPLRATLAVGSQGCADAGLCYPPQVQYFELNFGSGVVTAVAPPHARQAKTPPAPAGTGAGKLLSMLLLAFIGGTILNLMPCVFPILSLKVLSFTSSGDHDRHLHGWVFGVGVVTSFVVIAAVLIALQQAGRAVGWGFQLQSPGFVIALAYLFTVMGLSLSGLIQLGGNIMGIGSGLADRGGLTGSFFTGVLAVVVASPCTAPFMGTALGFAASQTPLVALLVFAALGAGMAAPLLLLSYSGAARKLMPRPGAWMETLKQLLAFPLYATAIWLLWVVGRQTGVNTMAAALAGVLAIALGLWLWQFGGWRKALALGCIVAAVSLGSWRALDEHDIRGQAAPGTVAYSSDTLGELRRAGKPVFVDVTADWCLTCLANESAVLQTAAMTAAFATHGVVYMIADWTNYDPEIARLLRQHNRAGIPLYLMYPADINLEPQILPQLLTRDTMLDALRSVSSQRPAVAAQLPGGARAAAGFPP